MLYSTMLRKMFKKISRLLQKTFIYRLLAVYFSKAPAEFELDLRKLLRNPDGVNYTLPDCSKKREYPCKGAKVATNEMGMMVAE